MRDTSLLPPSDPAAARPARILGLICAGSGLTSFYTLCFPPLIPFMKGDFDVSYAALGTMLTLRSIATGVMQVPMGVLVDRIGAKAVVALGLILMSGSFIALAVAPDYWWTLVVGVLFGTATATHRPGTYTILSAAIPRGWLGRAFSFSLLSSQLGRAAGPAAIVAIAAIWGWRWAVATAGVAGIAMTVAMILLWRPIPVGEAPPRPGKDGSGEDAPARPGILAEAIALFSSRTCVLLFLFYATTSLAATGTQSFSVVALMEKQGTSLTIASGALTGFLLAGAAGILAGGIIADKARRHETIAAVALLLSAILIALIGAISLSATLIVAIMSFNGFCQAGMRPSRDVMLRNLLPTESFGKSVGFVSAGSAIGGGIAPVVFGWLMDIGRAGLAFYLLAAASMMVAAIFIVPKPKVTGAG